MSGPYFGMTKEAGKTRFGNPCDLFMRELSINYPKQEADEEKIKKWLKKYEETQADKVKQEM